MTEVQHYPGQELELFANAHNWKRYVNQAVQPFLGPLVLEVGAGIGGMTRHLNDGHAKNWACMEPDADLLQQLTNSIESGSLPKNCIPLPGTLSTLEESQKFDSILYMDVIEHIEDDREELVRASHHIEPGGFLIVLAPAHPVLYTPFDKSIGHYRRYTKRMMRTVCPEDMQEIKIRYLDSIGLFASLGNRFLLRQSMPSSKQINFWDRYMVQLSRVIDPCLFFMIGKSVLGVWQKK